MRLSKEQKTSVRELIEAIRYHDWFFDRADDPRAYRKGRSERHHIHVLMKKVPAEISGAIWDAYLPDHEQFRGPA